MPFFEQALTAAELLREEEKQEPAHTPAPWTVTPWTENFGAYRIKEIEADIIRIGDNSEGVTEEQLAREEANRLLIECAPLLLTCVKLCKALLDSGLSNITAEQALMLNEKLSAVIDKAENV